MNSIYAVLAVVAAGLLSGVGIASAEIPSEVKIGGIFDYDWAEGYEGALITEIAVNDFNEYLANIGADWTMSVSLEDAQSNNNIALNKIQDFNTAQVDILVGVAYSSHINLAASYIKNNDILVLSHGSQADILSIDDTVFRLVPSDSKQAPAIVEMLEDAGIESLIFVYRGDTWGDGLVDNVKRLFNGTIVDDEIRYDQDTRVFSTEISVLNDNIIPEQIEKYGADAVGVLYVGTDEFLPFMQTVYPFYTNVDDVRWFGSNTQSVKTYFFEDDSAKDFAEATQFTATRSIPAGDSNAIREHIDAQYMEKYNSTVSTYGYAAYDSIWLLGTAILQTQSTDTLILTDAIPHVAAHMFGASGDLTLTEYGDLNSASFNVMQTSSDDWVQVDSTEE